MHKSTGDEIEMGHYDIYWLGDAVAFVLPYTSAFARRFYIPADIYFALQKLLGSQPAHRYGYTFTISYQARSCYYTFTTNRGVASVYPLSKACRTLPPLQGT